jgi:PAS domain S-box-containing protein
MGVVDSASERLRGEIALEAAFEAVIEMCDDAIFTCDAGGCVATWSATAERLFGHETEKVLGGPLDVVFPSHLRDEVRVVVAAVLAGDRIRHFETEIQRPDGMPLPVSLWMWDLRTGAVQWSLEFHRIHGVDPLDFGGTLDSYLELIHPSDRDPLRVALLESVRSGRPLEAQYRVVAYGESPRTVRLRAQPTVGSAGAAVGLRGIGQDVTDRIISSVTRDRPDS